MRILEENRGKINLKNVINEVKDWKNKKFSDLEIKDAYNKIKLLKEKNI